VGIGLTEPDATLHIQSSSISTPIFKIDSHLSANIMVIDGLGNVGIGVASPTSAMRVTGDIIANQIVDASYSLGTLLEVPTLNVSNDTGGGLPQNAQIISQVYGGENLSALNIDMTLTGDTDNNIAGVELTIDDISGGVAANGTAWGLRVSNDVYTEDPNFSTDEGVKYAAVFRGGNVGIATENPSVIFDVQGFSYTPGDTHVEIAAFSGGFQNPPAVGEITPIESTSLFLMGHSLMIERNPVPTDAFKTIMYEDNDDVIWQVDDDKATELMGLLRGSGDHIDSDNNDNVNGSYDSYTEILTAIRTEFGNYVDSEFVRSEDVARVLTQYIQTPRISMQTRDLNAGTSYNGLLFRGGTLPIEPFTEVIQASNGTFTFPRNAYTFDGRLGVNFDPNTDANWSLVDETLVINGDLKVGITTASVSADIDRTLHFSGGQFFTGSQDNENTDPLFIRRINNGLDKSELRVNIGEEVALPSTANAKFTIGYTNGTYTPVFTYKVETVSQVIPLITPDDPPDNEVAGYIGMGTTDPKALLHVRASKTVNEASVVSAGTAETAAKGHLMVIENETATGSNPHSMAIKLTGASGLNDTYNLVTFIVSTRNTSTGVTSSPTSIGAIEGNDDGVQFSSPEADYAEYLPKKNPDETFNPGDVVGVFNGKITKNTQGAQHIMVRSSNPIILGNWPGEDESKSEPVAFLGQVKVNVIGKVNAGDFIIPSGKDDGTAIAVNEANITLNDIDRIIGRAWEDSNKESVKTINTVVGFNFALNMLHDKKAELVSLKKYISEARTKTATLKAVYEKEVERRNQLISQISEQIKELKKSK